MKKNVRIYKGEKKAASVCCGSEVATALIDSCCGTQELPDDIKIAFLHNYLQDLNGSEAVNLEVTQLSDEESYKSFRQICLTSNIIKDDQKDMSNLLPLVVVDEKIRFVGRIPTGDELVEELGIR